MIRDSLKSRADMVIGVKGRTDVIIDGSKGLTDIN